MSSEDSEKGFLSKKKIWLSLKNEKLKTAFGEEA